MGISPSKARLAMKLNTPLKVIVGVLSLIVALLPIAFVVVWGVSYFLVLTEGTGAGPEWEGFDAFTVATWGFMCVVVPLSYVMTAFYIAHGIVNHAASDVLRIILLVLVVYMPFLGIPFYYCLYILPTNPPAWAMKAEPASA